MDMSENKKDEMMIKLRDELLAVEQDRLSGVKDYSVDEIEIYLSEIIDNPNKQF